MMTTLLKFGMRGGAVEELQRLLNQHGAAIRVDGHFWRRTREAVWKFQQDAGLAVDGLVGRRTWAALRQEVGAAARPTLPSDDYAKRVVLMAESLLDVREEPPESNRGPVVDQIIRSTGLAPPAQWCMAFCYFVHHKVAEGTGRSTDCPRTARCSTGWKRAVQGGLWFRHPDQLNPDELMGGEIFMRVRGKRPRSEGEREDAMHTADMVRDGHNLSGHVGIITHSEGGRLYTIEGNTNGRGSATGHGVYRRYIDLDDARLVGVYRPRAV